MPKRVVYVTKYALTQGVFTVEAVPRGSGSTGDSSWETAVYASTIGVVSYGTLYILGTEAFFTEEEAKQNAEKRRQVKIAALKKQITKLEKLTFE